MEEYLMKRYFKVKCKIEKTYYFNLYLQEYFKRLKYFS